MKKKIISASLVLAVLLSSIFCFTSFNALADAEGYCGAATSALGSPQKNATYKYVEATQTLTISGTGATKDYGDTRLNSRPWDSYKDQITTVIVEEGITELGTLIFYNFTALTSISLPSTLETIAGGTANYGAFRGCTALKSITLPEGLTTIEAMAFRDCTALEHIKFPNSLKTLGTSAFQGCTGITSVTYGTGMTSTGQNAFRDCTNLNSIIFSPTITKIDEYSFYNTRLTSVEIPETVESIGTRAFANCSFLSKVTIHNINCKFEGIIGEDPFNGSSQQLKIYGHSGSTAQTYAQDKGYIFVSLDECPHEVTHNVIVTPPTCTEIGHSQEVCDNCQAVVSDSDIPALNHSYVLTYVQDSTEEDGHIYNVYTCSTENCGDEKVVIEHKATMEGLYEFKRVGSCKTGGFETKTCTICGNVDRTVIVIGDHKVDSYKTTLEPTCTTPGTGEGVCSECSETVTINIPASGHTNELVEEVDGTAEDGHIYSVYECSVCGEETIDAVHVEGIEWIEGSYTSTVITEPRCVINGVRRDVCDVCGKSRLVQLPANGEHMWYETTRTQPTCTAVGKIYYACENCNLTKSENIDALGHSYVLQEASSVPATCTQSGYNMYKCSVCAMTNKETLPATNHTADEENYDIIVEPDCENDGLAKSVCTVCGVGFDITLASPGHSFEAVVVPAEDKPGHSFSTPTCTVCGQTDKTETIHDEWVEGYYTIDHREGTCLIAERTTKTCNICAKTETQTGKVTGHKYRYTATKNDGTLVYNCVGCNREQTNNPTYVAGLFSAYINTSADARELGYLFELNFDGVINAKDYSLINKAVIKSKAYK